jgi:thiamine-phosphate pyrophosphorylase
LAFSKIRKILAAGVDIAQLRCKGLSDRVFLEYARRLKKVCGLYNILFIVNDRPEIALASDADGLHVGQDDIPPLICRKIIGEKKILGLSTHSIAQAKKAFNDKSIDYIGIGPIFNTETKPDKSPIGLKVIRRISRRKASTPFFAIGGINLSNIDKLMGAGAKNIALSSAVFDARVPAAVVKRLKDKLYDSN